MTLLLLTAFLVGVVGDAPFQAELVNRSSLASFEKGEILKGFIPPGTEIRDVLTMLGPWTTFDMEGQSGMAYYPNYGLIVFFAKYKVTDVATRQRSAHPVLYEK